MKKSTSKTIVFTGGGTGGHIYPNLALIPSFENKDFKCVYIGGAESSLECRLAKQHGLDFYSLKTIKLIRSFKFSAIINNLKILYTLPKSIFDAKKILVELKPSIVFSKGGFVSLPITLASLMLKIPTFSHESDYTLGLANKIAYLCGSTTLKGNPKSKFKGEFVGIPLRQELFVIDQKTSIEKLKIQTDKKILLVVGGSSGSSSINELIWGNIDFLLSKFFVIHITGKNKLKKIDNLDNTSFDNNKQNSAIIPISFERKNYLQIEYTDNIGDYLNASDIIISRAGATAVFEISTLRKKAIFIPLPKGISRGDQIYNGELAKEYGAKILIEDENIQNDFLKLIKNMSTMTKMTPISTDINGKIVSLVCDSIRRGELCKDNEQSQNG